MFKKLLVLVTTMLILSSCEKAVLPESESSDAQSGNLRVKVYEIEKTPFASLTRATDTRAEAVSAVCTRLNFAVYDDGGSRVKQINQTSDKVGFGTCSFQLDEGNYQLVVVAHSAKGNPTMTNPSKIQFTNATGYTDTFLFRCNVTIGEDEQEVSVSLDRIVALCRFVITDDIPAEVKKLQFYYTGGSGAFNAATGFGSVNSKQTVTYDVTPGQKQFDLYTFLHEKGDNIALKVSALDANGNTLYVHDFDVPMQQNYISWLSGACFSGSGSSSSNTFTIVKVNTDWAGEMYQTF